MKRVIPLLIGMFFVLTACQGPPKDMDAALDSGRGFLHYGGMGEVCATEDTVYFTSGELIHYYDKASGTSGVLCGKPECEHSTASGSGCNAYIGSSSDSLCVYNNRLYWVSGYPEAICSMALDGTDHRTGRQLENDVYSAHYGSSSAIFHRGCAYVWVINYAVRDGKEVARLDLAAVPLDPDREVHMIFREELPDMAASNSSYVTMQAYGDVLYILTNWAANSHEGDPGVYDFQIRRYHAETQELTTLYHDSKSPIDYTVEMWVMDGGVVFLGHDGHSGRLFKFDFETSGITRLFTPTGAVAVAEDLVVSHRYTYQKSNPTNPWGLTLAVQDIEVDGELDVIIYDFIGEVLLNGTYRLDGRFNSPEFYGIDETYAYFLGSTNFGGTTYMSLIGAALDGSGGAEVLCTEEEFYDLGGGHSTTAITQDDGTTVTVDGDIITVIPGDGGETVIMTVEELIEKGYQP
ncbi:MAG: hypothetical protein K2K53_11210 [Oscillospiraceae bacterium]|nr:hypothetical protein [Oscillospiraceae bacterium]